MYLIKDEKERNFLNILHITSAIDCLKRDIFLKMIIMTPKIDMNFRGIADGDEVTAAHLAAMWGYEKTLKILLYGGCDPFIVDDYGNTAYDHASDNGHFKCVQVLEQFYKRMFLDEKQIFDNDITNKSFNNNNSANELSSSQTFLKSLNDSFQSKLNISPRLSSRRCLFGASSSTKKKISNVLSEITPSLIICDFSFDDTPEKKNQEIICKNIEKSVNDSESEIQSEISYYDPVTGITLIEQKLDFPRNSLTKEESTIITGPATDTNKENDQFENNNFEDSIANLNDSQIRNELNAIGNPPGPLTPTTRNLYIKKLRSYRKGNLSPNKIDVPLPGYSRQLNMFVQNVISFNNDGSKLEIELIKEMEKLLKRGKQTYFTYLLLDPRLTNNLPSQAASMDPQQINTILFKEFIKAIFYVGKGQGSRPHDHLYEAAKKYGTKSNLKSKKVRKIIEIWTQDKGVISLQCFLNISNKEALTREKLMIDALGLENLTNIKNGTKVPLKWNDFKKKICGSFLLFKAFQLLLISGERQIKRFDN